MPVVSERMERSSLLIFRRRCSIFFGKLEQKNLITWVQTHQCEPDSIHLPSEMNGTFDAAFTIFVVHEIPDPA
jgi:hypothetical protein